MSALIVSPSFPVFGQSTTIVVKGKKAEKKVCKVYDAPTGSHVGQQRICKTQEEWNFDEQTADRNMARENLRLNADNSQRHNEEGAFASNKPH
ncbi:MAG TPA: hypothetical protein VH392_06260 [Sphingomicrobium sp.]